MRENGKHFYVEGTCSCEIKSEAARNLVYLFRVPFSNTKVHVQKDHKKKTASADECGSGRRGDRLSVRENERERERSYFEGALQVEQLLPKGEGEGRL
jgi:hypothetical protein